MRLILWKKRLAGAFGIFAGAMPPTLPTLPRKPEDVVCPEDKAPLMEHVRFLLEAKRYIANHPVPENCKNTLNQYSHAGMPPITANLHDPAITNCSYEFFNSKLISIGFPLFVRQAPLIKDNRFNPAFNGPVLWDSFMKLLEHKIPQIKTETDSDAKYGFYRPTNHYYIEKRVSQDAFDRAQPIIEFYTRTQIEDAATFLKKLDEHLSRKPQAAAPSHAL